MESRHRPLPSIQGAAEPRTSLAPARQRPANRPRRFVEQVKRTASEGDTNNGRGRRALTGAKRDADSEGWNWKDATVAADAATASPAIFRRLGAARSVACLLLKHLSAPFVGRVD